MANVTAVLLSNKLSMHIRKVLTRVVVVCSVLFAFSELGLKPAGFWQRFWLREKLLKGLGKAFFSWRFDNVIIHTRSTGILLLIVPIMSAERYDFGVWRNGAFFLQSSYTACCLSAVHFWHFAIH